MFYVSGSKIYLATFDVELKIYPEVRLAWVDPEHMGVVKTGRGIAQKPKVYSLCTLTELIAQFGGMVTPDADEDEDEVSVEE